MNMAVALWVFGALMALFFAWILGYMQRGDTRIRTQRVAGLEVRPIDRLVPGEVNAARGTLEAAGDPQTSPVTGSPALFVDVVVTREGTAGGKPQPEETLHQERTHVASVLRTGDQRAKLDLGAAVVHPRSNDVSREVEWRDGELTAENWNAAGFTDAERRFVSSHAGELPGALESGVLRLRYQQLKPGDEALVVGEVSGSGAGTTLGSTARHQLEVTSGSLADYQRGQLGASRTMQLASRAFVGLAVLLVVAAGLTYAGVLS